jgi:hypothetical protein
MRLALEAPERQRDPAASGAAVERPLGRGDADALSLAAELQVVTLELRRLWADNTVRTHATLPKRLQHAIGGELTLEYSAFAVDGAEGLSLIVCTPASEADATALATILAFADISHTVHVERNRAYRFGARAMQRFPERAGAYRSPVIAAHACSRHHMRFEHADHGTEGAPAVQADTQYATASRKRRGACL